MQTNVSSSMSSVPVATASTTVLPNLGEQEDESESDDEDETGIGEEETDSGEDEEEGDENEVEDEKVEGGLATSTVSKIL